MKSYQSILTLLFTFVFSLTTVANDAELADAKNNFEKMENKMDATYAEVLKTIPKENKKDLIADQESWIIYREFMLENGPNHGKAVQDTASYWLRMSIHALGRIQYLEGWKLIKDKSWTGLYRDGAGGTMLIIEDKGTLFFKIHVMRGPSYHTGSIEAEVKLEGSEAHFSDKKKAPKPDENADPEQAKKPVATIDFKKSSKDGRVQVTGKNTQEYHGARAYFDGNFLRIRDLTAEEIKERKIIIKEEKK